MPLISEALELLDEHRNTDSIVVNATPGAVAIPLGGAACFASSARSAGFRRGLLMSLIEASIFFLLFVVLYNLGEPVAHRSKSSAGSANDLAVWVCIVTVVIYNAAGIVYAYYGLSRSVENPTVWLLAPMLVYLVSVIVCQLWFHTSSFQKNR